MSWICGVTLSAVRCITDPIIFDVNSELFFWCSVAFIELAQRILKCSDSQNTSLTLDNELNIVICGMTFLYHQAQHWSQNTSTWVCSATTIILVVVVVVVVVVVLTANVLTCVEEGQEIKTNGTSCTDAICQCRLRDSYRELDGRCVQCPTCDKGFELTGLCEFLFLFLFRHHPLFFQTFSNLASSTNHFYHSIYSAYCCSVF